MLIHMIMWFLDASHHYVTCPFWKKKVTCKRKTTQKRAGLKKSGYKKPRRAAIGKRKSTSIKTSRKHPPPNKVRRQNKHNTSKSTSSEKLSAKSPNRRAIIHPKYDNCALPSLVAPNYYPLLGPFGMLFNDIYDYQLDIPSSHLYCAIRK